MVLNTFIDFGTTIQNTNLINTGLSPLATLYQGGNSGQTQYSRYIFYVDLTRLTNLYTGGTFTDLTKLSHTLNFTNTGLFTENLNKTVDFKNRASSFDLVVFPVTQTFDSGKGYDQTYESFTAGNSAVSTCPSNWVYSQTNIPWSEQGVYSGSPTIIATQHFDLGNENLQVDISDYVNGVLTGDTNYGLGLAFSRSYELFPSSSLNFIEFFSNHTQSAFLPFVQSTYSNNISDDRNDFFLDKSNNLYLYVNLLGNPTNLDTPPSLVNIYDQNNNLFSAYTGSQITHVTRGVYSINLLVPTTSAYTENYMFNDVWEGITINGVTRPDISLEFALKSSYGYYNVGECDSLPKRVAVSVSGIKSGERIFASEIRRVMVSCRIPYTINQTQNITDITYRIYTLEGLNQLTIIPPQQLQKSSNGYYFLLDVLSLIPSTYYLEIVVNSNLEVINFENVISFDIVSQSNKRTSG